MLSQSRRHVLQAVHQQIVLRSTVEYRKAHLPIESDTVDTPISEGNWTPEQFHEAICFLVRKGTDLASLQYILGHKLGCSHSITCAQPCAPHFLSHTGPAVRLHFANRVHITYRCQGPPRRSSLLCSSHSAWRSTTWHPSSPHSAQAPAELACRAAAEWPALQSGKQLQLFTFFTRCLCAWACSRRPWLLSQALLCLSCRLTGAPA